MGRAGITHTTQGRCGGAAGEPHILGHPACSPTQLPAKAMGALAEVQAPGVCLDQPPACGLLGSRRSLDLPSLRHAAFEVTNLKKCALLFLLNMEAACPLARSFPAAPLISLECPLVWGTWHTKLPPARLAHPPGTCRALAWEAYSLETPGQGGHPGTGL